MESGILHLQNTIHGHVAATGSMLPVPVACYRRSWDGSMDPWGSIPCRWPRQGCNQCMNDGMLEWWPYLAWQWNKMGWWDAVTVWTRIWRLDIPMLPLVWIPPYVVYCKTWSPKQFWRYDFFLSLSFLSLLEGKKDERPCLWTTARGLGTHRSTKKSWWIDW